MPYRVPKTVLPISLVFLSLLVNFSCKEKETQIKKPAQPNFLVILVDDLGYSDLGCLGSTYYETPNIDGLAAKGVTFTNGYAACQVCSPSRASIMSGKLPARHGITDYIGAKTGTEWRKAKREPQLLPPEYVAHLPHE
jgi:arylsulfatase A-like enzyme